MRRNFREERCNISWNSIVDNFQQNYRFSFNTLPTAMSTRRSSRMPSSSAPTNGARSGPATVLATAPVAKRRRKNTIHKCSQHAGADPSSTDAKSLLPEPDLPGVAIKREGGGGALASSSCCAPSSPQATSVVLVEVPGGFSFSQAACSYGYYIVPPNLWQPSKDSPDDKDAGTFTRPLRFGPRLTNVAQCVISQVAAVEDKTSLSAAAAAAGGGASVALRVTVSAVLADSDREDIRLQVVRMFQTTIDLKPWFKLSAEAKTRCFGRLFRSPTLFEDMVKSITGCNMKFQGTIRMNKLLCEEFGRDQAFPTPEDLEGVEAEDLKVKAKVGYRGDRILRLASGFRDGTIDPAWLEAPERTREEVMKFVKSLHGFGDYAAGNVAMLLGFYAEIPLDSETVRHFKDYHGVTTKNVKEVAPKAKEQYAPYAPYQFLQYWYEMVVWHEKKRGQPVHLWDVNDFALYG